MPKLTLGAIHTMTALPLLALNHTSKVLLLRRLMRQNNCHKFSDTSITDFLLSPLLVKKGNRPNLVRKPKAQHTPKPRADVTAAATVARKPSSSPANLPNIQGNVSFRLSSLPLLHASSFSDPMICHSFFFCFIFIFIFALLHVHSF